jgi:hypothetical protein
VSVRSERLLRRLVTPSPRIDGVPEPEVLGFVPRASVRWLGPRGLLVTGYQVFLSGIFSRYADKREMQAALKEPKLIDRSALDELWFDWLADTGDGFDASYATAALLAEPNLTLPMAEGEAPTLPTERGKLLVLGGDLAYPAANPDQYRDRMIGPYRAAFPAVPAGEEPPSMIAVAGNHDWYDGLTSFLRLYCRQLDIGGWRTEQSRSYFTLKLPRRWWLLGIDVVLDEFIDVPQLDYFKDVVQQHMEPGDRVIVALHQPSWMFNGLTRDAEANRLAVTNLEDFEREVLHPSGVRNVLTIAGDIHHYNRYEREDGVQTRITSGSGSAFLYPTHNIPERVRWNDADGVHIYEKRHVYPDVRTSKRLRWRTLLAPFLNPSFILFVGVIYLLFAIMLADALTDPGDGLFDTMRALEIADIRTTAISSAGMVVLFLILLVGFIGFANGRTLLDRVVAGVVHASFQLEGLIWVSWFVARIAPERDTVVFRLQNAVLDVQVHLFALVYAVLVVLLGGLVGSYIYSIYLFLMQTLFKRHPTHSFSAFRWEHHRNFLRLHIDEQGVLTIYSIGVRRVPRRWRYVATDEREPWQRWFEPVDRPLEPFLVEPPLRLGVDGGSRTAEASDPGGEPGLGLGERSG